MSEYRAIYKCHLCGEEFEDARIDTNAPELLRIWRIK